MRRFPVTLILLLVSSSLAVAQNRPVSVPPDSARGRAAMQFRQEHGPEWQITWHERAGTPATLLGGTARDYGGPPAEAGRAFLRAHKTLFGVQNARRELEVASSSRSENGSSRVQYRQVYKGIPVLYSGYLVAFSSEGAVHYVSGGYYPDLQVDSSPQLQPSDVVETIQSDLGDGSSFEIRQKPVLAVFVDDRGERLTAHLVYEARAERRDPLKALKYVVDAQSGFILQKISLINEIYHGASAREKASADPQTGDAAGMIPGTGDVYTTNPLHGSPTSVTLHRLRDVSPRELYGFDVDINDRFGNDATSSSGSFHYSPSDHRFGQVMTYYHSDEFEAWLVGDIGMSSTRLDGEVDVETRSAQCYACMDSPNQNAYFSDGSGSTLKNPTRERSIIAHEYMHAVSHTYNSLEQDFEADALDEGYSDFFAVADRHANTSVTSKRLGAYVGFSSGRTVDNSYQVDDFYAGQNGDLARGDLTNDGNFSEHDGGVVLAGAMWDFKQAINDAALTAEITLASLGNLDSNPSFYDARTAMIAAANSMGNSQYECDIKHAFADHGIGEAFSVYLGGDDWLDTGEQGTWTASVSCGTGTLSYNWEYMSVVSSTWSSASCTGPSCSHTFFNYGSSQVEKAHMRVTVTDGSEQNQASMSVYVRPVSYYASLAEGDVLVGPSAAGDAPGRVVAFGGLVASAGGSGIADLRWSTTAPLPPSEFVVQHRTDPTAEWSKVGTVDAADTVRVDTTAGPTYRFETDELGVGTHQFRLTYFPPGAANGSRWTSEAVTATLELKSAYELSAYPNPVRNRATIELAVREAQDVTVAVYDVLGRRVATLHDGSLSAHEQHRFFLNAQSVGLPSGSYFVRARGDTFRGTKRLTVVR